MKKQRDIYFSFKIQENDTVKNLTHDIFRGYFCANVPICFRFSLLVVLLVDCLSSFKNLKTNSQGKLVTYQLTESHGLNFMLVIEKGIFRQDRH